MLRAALAIYLIMLTAAGPCACCCVTGRLAAWLVSPAPEAAPTCCQHKAAGRHEARAPGDGPRHRHSPDRPGCPCKDGPALEGAVLPASPEDRAEGPVPAGLDWLAAARLPGPLVPDCGGPATRRVVTAGPFLSAEDRLHAHHALRC